MSNIEELLERLRLLGFKNALHEELQQAQKTGCALTESLYRLLAAEYAHRQQQSMLYRLRQAKIPFDWTLESFPFKKQPAVNKKQILQLSELSFIASAHNIVLIGEPGTGKTGLAIGLLRKALIAGYRGRFYNAQNYVHNGNVPATGVIITETVPAGTVFNAGASTAGWVCVPDNSAGSTCTLTIGTLNDGANGSPTFAVDVLNPFEATNPISNTAVISDDGASGADATPAVNIATDTTSVTVTPTPSETPITPTDTPVTPTDTPVTPTDTPVTPTDTPVTPTDTPITPTLTPSNTPCVRVATAPTLLCA